MAVVVVAAVVALMVVAGVVAQMVMFVAALGIVADLTVMSQMAVLDHKPTRCV